MNAKKIILLVLLIALVVTTAAGLSYAYSQGFSPDNSPNQIFLVFHTPQIGRLVVILEKEGATTAYEYIRSLVTAKRTSG